MLFRLPLVYLIVLLGGFLTLTKLQMDGMADDPGLGWHISTGAWSIENKNFVPELDPFLFSPTPRKWISDQWLSDIALAALYKLGWPTLYAFICVIFLLTFFWLVYRNNAHRVSTGFAAMAAFLSLQLSVIHFIVRPVVFSFLFFALLLNYLYKIHVNQKISKQNWFILPCLFLLWTNCHPSFVLGLLLIALSMLSIALERLVLKSSSISSGLTEKLILLFITCSIATLINPYGIALHKSILYLSESSFFLSFHQEWLGLDFRSTEGTRFSLICLIIISVIFLRGREALKLHVFDILPSILFAYLACRSVRFLPYFAIVCSLPLAVSLNALFKNIISHFIKSKSEESLSLFAKIIFSALIAIIIISATIFKTVPTYTGEYGPSKNVYPYAAINLLLAKGADNSIILSTPDWGGFISWYGKGKFKPLIDDRNTLLGEDFYMKYIESMKASGDWFSYAKSLGANYILLPRKHALNREIQRDGKVNKIYEDEQAVLYWL